MAHLENKSPFNSPLAFHQSKVLLSMHLLTRRNFERIEKHQVECLSVFSSITFAVRFNRSLSNSVPQFPTTPHY